MLSFLLYYIVAKMACDYLLETTCYHTRLNRGLSTLPLSNTDVPDVPTLPVGGLSPSATAPVSPPHPAPLTSRPLGEVTAENRGRKRTVMPSVSFSDHKPHSLASNIVLILQPSFHTVQTSFPYGKPHSHTANLVPILQTSFLFGNLIPITQTSLPYCIPDFSILQTSFPYCKFFPTLQTHSHAI